MKNKRSLEEYFIGSKLLAIKLIDYAVTHVGEKLPTSYELSESFGVGVNTVKKVCSELSRKGYLNANKKRGTEVIRKFSSEQVAMYLSFRERFREIFSEMERSGFNFEELIACLFSSLEGYEFSANGVIYTEKDTDSLFVSREELEDKIGVPVTPLYFNDVVNRLKDGTLKAMIVIVPFYCSFALQDACSYPGIKIFPIKTTHPLDILSELKSIPANVSRAFISVSPSEKDSIIDLYPGNVQPLRVYTIEEVRESPELLSGVEMVVALKWVVSNNEWLFRSVPRIVTYSRFNDDEGFRMIKLYMENNKGWRSDGYNRS